MDAAPTEARQARLATYHQRRKAARREAGLDEAWNSRVMARKLVDDAAALVDLRAAASTRSRVVRLLCAVFEVSGGLNLRRGWVGRVQEVLADAGAPVPSPRILRCYRSRLSDDPMYVARTPLVDVATLERIGSRHLRP
jgi:hypothetical protein